VPHHNKYLRRLFVTRVLIFFFCATVSQAPWYLNQKGPGLKHQRAQNLDARRQGSFSQWYERGQKGQRAKTFRKGLPLLLLLYLRQEYFINIVFKYVFFIYL
jgi:hypothetical protein